MLKKLALVAIVLLILALVIPFLIPLSNLDGVIPDQPFADSQFADIDGVRLHWRQRMADTAQDRPLVVLLHGLGGSGFSWRHTLDALEQAGHPVIAPDLPPFGYSQRTAAGPAWPELVSALSDQVAPGAKVVLIGHSMGADVAAKIAAAVPERVEQLILVDGTPGLNRSSGRLSWLVLLPSVARWLEVFASRQLVNEETITELLTSAFGRPPDGAELEGYFEPLSVPHTYPAVLRRMSSRSETSDNWLQVETTLIWGEKDAWIPLDHARSFVDKHPELSSIQIIPDSGHNPMDTHPNELNSLLLDLLILDP